jgi:hypothetical protein
VNRLDLPLLAKKKPGIPGFFHFLHRLPLPLSQKLEDIKKAAVAALEPIRFNQALTSTL